MAAAGAPPPPRRPAGPPLAAHSWLRVVCSCARPAWPRWAALGGHPGRCCLRRGAGNISGMCAGPGGGAPRPQCQPSRAATNLIRVWCGGAARRRRTRRGGGQPPPAKQPTAQPSATCGPPPRAGGAGGLVRAVLGGVWQASRGTRLAWAGPPPGLRPAAPPARGGAKGGGAWSVVLIVALYPPPPQNARATPTGAQSASPAPTHRPIMSASHTPPSCPPRPQVSPPRPGGGGNPGERRG